LQVPRDVSRVRDEIARQLAELPPREDLAWTPWDHVKHRRRYLDPKRAALQAVTRLQDCGTFPRGRVTLFYKDGTKKHLGAHQCRHRACPVCGKRRGSKLYSEIAPAVARIQAWGFDWARVRFLTLTLPNTDSVHVGMEALASAWHRFLANPRTRRLIAGGFRCFEVKPGQDGRWNIHLHAIVWTWAVGAPYAVLRQIWDKAARAPQGQTFNQRFDELRKKAKPMPGETKASAAARYLVKYLAKLEDLEGAAKAPGGLPHMLAALEGRRMFADFGVGKAARRIHRHESPAWLANLQRHLDGHRNAAGEQPVSAHLDGPGWKGFVRVPVPPTPAALSEHEIPEQLEKVPARIRDVRAGRPLDQYEWKKIPSQGNALKKWLAWREIRQEARERIRAESSSVRAFRRSWRAWREGNALFETQPDPFRWGSFVTLAPKTWTREAETILGERITGTLGAALWSRVLTLDEDAHIPDTDPRHWSGQMVHAVETARRTVARRLYDACPEERMRLISELPMHIARHFQESDHDGQGGTFDPGREVCLFEPYGW
jgi:Replication protein/Transposase zinc-binding domain